MKTVEFKEGFLLLRIDQIQVSDEIFLLLRIEYSIINFHKL